MALQIGFKSNRIDAESKEIDKLLLAAKMGKWATVWQVLGTTDRPRNAHLLNCIPEGRRWAVLHQAVYWRDPENLAKLLKFPGCDTNNRAKRCKSECGDTSGMTALEIAKAYKYDDIVTLLKGHHDTHSFGEETTFAAYDTTIGLKGTGIVAITLAAFKTTFHPEPIDKTLSTTEVLKGIFEKMNASPDLWQKVRDHVCDTLYVVNEVSSREIMNCSTDRDKFYRSIINAYTIEDTFLYDNANTVLRHQTETNYRPSARDLAMGPYILMYNMLLLYWDVLPKESATTYRRVLLKKEHSALYQPLQRFSWLGFVSSSMEMNYAIAFPTCVAKGDFNVVFTIDNSIESDFQPRDIELYARYTERERVYPGGARFQVMRRKQEGDVINVQLKLVN